MKIKTTIVAMGLLVNLLNAQSLNHQFHVGVDSYSGDINADCGLNIGYAYEWGEDWKYALGANITMADDSGETGDAITFDAKIGKEIFTNTTAYGFVGLTGMGTGLKNSLNKDVAAGGVTYGVLINYAISDSYDLQFGYKGYDLEYTLDSVDKDMHIDSSTISLVYKF
jgi:hypothetical protein